IAVVDAVNQALAAGRGGGFARSVFGARQALNVGATSQAVDNIAKGIGQINAQKNKAGIQQNLQALQQYQRLLQSVGADDPNANKAVELQGLILEKINQNLDAQKQLNTATKAQGNIFKIPPLTAPITGKGAQGGKANRQSQLADILAANGLYRSQQSLLERISQAELNRDTQQVLYLQHVQRGVELLDQAAKIQRDETLPADENQAQLRGIQDKLAASTAQYNREIAEFQRQAAESLPDYINDLSAAAAGYSNVLDYSQRLTEEQIKQKEISEGIANVIGQGMTSAFDALIEGSESFGNSLRKIASGVLTDIARQLLQIYVINQAINAISNLFGPKTGGFLPNVGFKPSAFSMPLLAGAKANGGPVMAGQSYLVGEKGPEIFTPNKSGAIIPNGAIGASNIVVNVDAGGSNVQGDGNQAKALGAAIGAAVQAEIIKQKKPGGLLY
ncbi:MAG: phage tail tape measure protein, partial [Candidatus Nanopelagicales bacterium]